MEFGNNLIPFIVCCTQVLLLSLLLLSTVVKLYEFEFSMKSNDSNIIFFFFSFLFFHLGKCRLNSERQRHWRSMFF